MPRTKLFISHSTREPTRERLDALIEALDDNGNGYDVLVDHRFIESGDQWRERIHVALAECQAAVILFDPQAMASPWVLKEATILGWRKDLEDEKFQFLPVRLGSVTEDELAARDYSPLLLNETQHVVSGDVGDIVSAVRNRIPAGLASPTLLDDLADAIADKLHGLPGGRVLERVAADHFDAPRLTRGEGRRAMFAELLARKLLTVGPGCLSEAVKILGAFGRSLDADVATSIIRVLDPMWVESDAAALLSRPRYRALAMCSLNLNAFYDFTAQRYIARGTRTVAGWEMLRVEDAADDDEVSHIRRAIRSEFKEKNRSARIFDDTSLDERIRKFGTPLYVLLPSVPDDDVLASVEAAYPNITFLMYTDQRGEARGPLKDTARYVDPELSIADEEKALTGRDDADRLIRRLNE